MNENESNNLEEKVNEEKFIPSYNRSNEDKKNDEKNDKKSKNKSNKKFVLKDLFKSKRALVVIVLIVILVSFIGYIIINRDNSALSDYDTLMEKYGFSTLYNNGSSNHSEKITKSEAIKIAVAAFLNTDDITKNMYEFKSGDKLEYKNQNFVDYAISIKMINANEITKDNENEYVSYADAIKYVLYAKQKILAAALDVDKEVKYTDYESYTTDQKWGISDATYNEVLDNKKAKLNGNKDVNKSKYNELIIRSIIKYNLITMGDDKININKDKIPSNKDEYPYTLSNINKSVYEMKFSKINDNFKNPIEVYASLKNRYKTINDFVTGYVNTIYNLDYKNIDTKNFKTVIYEDTMYYTDSNKVTSYLDNVVKNKVKITNETKVQLPVIYFDGEKYRARVKIKFNVESASDLNNLVYGDNNVIYKTGENTIYVDFPFYIDETTSYIYVKDICINDYIVKE